MIEKHGRDGTGGSVWSQGIVTVMETRNIVPIFCKSFLLYIHKYILNIKFNSEILKRTIAANLEDRSLPMIVLKMGIVVRLSVRSIKFLSSSS